MTRGARGLDYARRLFRARRFREVLRLLEPQIFRFRTDPTYYALLGLSCLQTGELGGAGTYLGRAMQLDDQNVDVLIGLAAVHLRRRESEPAIACWLRVLDIDPKNKIARKGLDTLRSSGGVVPDGLSPDSLRAFFPPVARRTSRGLLWIVAAVVLAGAGYGAYRLIGVRLTPARAGIEEVVLPAGEPRLLSAPGESLITMTEQELERSFSRAKRLLLDRRDNAAVHELDRILLSNASLSVKEKARLLKSFAEEPDFSTIRDAFPYQVVKASPEEYEDCHVRWSGRIANTRIGDSEITFDLLVGYQDGRVLEGVVPVAVGFAVAVEDGLAYEVLGRVLLTADGGIALRAISIRPIASRPGSAP